MATPYGQHDSARAPDWLPVGGALPPASPHPPHPLPTQHGLPPQAAPPPPPRRPARWPSLVVSVLLVVAMVGGGAVVARSVTPPTSFDTFLPSDGQRDWVRTDDGDGQVEQALLRAPALNELGPVAEPVLAGLTGTDAAATTFLRATVNPGSVEAWFAADADGLSLSVVSAPRQAFALVPGLEVVRRSGRVAAEQHGSLARADGGVPYTAQVTTRDDDGCQVVTADVTAGSDTLTITLTVCPSRGIVALRIDDGVHPVGYAPGGPDLSGPFDGPTQVTAPHWEDPGSFAPTVLPVRGANAWGTYDIVARPLQARPAVTPSGRLFVAGLHTNDVEAYDQDGDSLRLSWRVHPGDSITAIAAVGELLVVAAGPRLSAYTPDGLLAWELALDEQVVGSLLAVPGAVSFATLDGGVWFVAAATGEVVWHEQMDHPIEHGVVGDDRFVLVADTAGGLGGWTPSGQQIFYDLGKVDEQFDLLVVNPEVNFLLRGRAIEAYEQQHATFLWSALAPALPTAGCGLPGQVVLAMPSATVALDQATGTVAWSAAGARDVLCAGTAALLVADRAVAVVAPDGTVRPTVELPESLVTGAISGAVAGPDAAWLVLPGAVVRLG